MSSSKRATGNGDGRLWACGQQQRNRDELFRDKASARVFRVPARWDAEMSKLNLATIKCRQRNKFITVGSLLVPVLIM